MAVYDWILGLGLIFGLGFFINYIVGGNFRTFFIFATVIDVFVVYAGFLELWTLVLFIIIDCFIVYISISNRGGNII